MTGDVGDTVRKRTLVAVMVASLLGLTACGTDSAPPAGADSVADSADQTVDSPTADPIVGQWIGTWRSAGESKVAVLNIGRSKPLRATIDIRGRCGADWMESGRKGNAISVDATVSYGACSDNRWTVVIADNEITATDPDNDANSLKFAK